MCECISGFFRTLLVILLFPVIMLVWFCGLIIFIIVSPCYCIGYCCCSANGCGYMCIERNICQKMLCFPCHAFEWACKCCCGPEADVHHAQKMKKPKGSKGSGPKIPKAASRDKVYYAPRDGAVKDNYVARTGAMA